MFKQTTLKPTERKRLLDYLIFRLRHGGNVVSAMRTYMEGNKSKASRPVQEMLDRIAAGEDFVAVARTFGLVDRYGSLILAAGIEPSKALPVIRDSNVKANFGVTAIVLKEIVTKYLFALLIGLVLTLDKARSPMVSIYEQLNRAATAAGATAEPLPVYLAQPWLVAGCVIAAGVLMAAIGAGVFWINKYRTGVIYRLFRFRFYEDWSGLLALFLAFKAAGQSDVKAAQSLAAACPEGSFTQRLFEEMAQLMRQRGRSFYDALAVHEGAIPPVVLTFFLDASKTGQIDSYLGQARAYCDARVESLTAVTREWMPALTGIVLLMVFGSMMADLFISMTTTVMKPLSG